MYNIAMTAAQSAKVTITTMTASARYIGVAVRCAASGNGYFYIASSGARVLQKVVNGSLVDMCAGAGTGVVAGDTLEIRANGTSIQAYYNGVLDAALGACVAPTTGSNGDYVDSTFSSGFTGICAYTGDTGYVADADTFIATELGATTYAGILYVFDGANWVPRPMANYAPSSWTSHPVYAYYNNTWNLIQSF
jgi:hypothetical protein